MSPEAKPILVFIPQYLHQGFGFLSFVKIIKRGINLDYQNLTFRELQPGSLGVSEAGYMALRNLTDASLGTQKNEIEKLLKRSAAASQLKNLVKRKILRQIHDSFTQGLANWKNLPWYHQTKDPVKKNIRKSPCSFENAPVKIKFKVERHEEDGLRLVKMVQIGKTNYNLSDFNRSAFFIEYQATYFLISFSDYLVLEWLDELKYQHYAFNAKEFYQQVVSKLMAKGCEVDRNNCFGAKRITSAPEARILVSEISNAFLQFIPAFNYEGILVDHIYQEEMEVERQGELYTVLRDKKSETALIDNIRSRHPNFTTQFNNNFFVSFAEAKKNNWFLKVYQEWIDQGIEIIGLDLLEHFRYSSFKIDTVIKWVSTDAGISTLEFRVSFGEEVIRNKEIQKIIQAGQKSILLEDHTIGVFTEDWLMDYALLIKHSKVNASNQLLVSNRLLQGMENKNAIQLTSQIISADWQQKWKTWQDQSGTVYTLPSKLKASLRPYQIKGFEWLCLLSEIGAGACLADDMGLGKTLQTIAFMAHWCEQHAKSKFLIVCPASLIYNWKAELEKFAPHLPVRIGQSSIDELASFVVSSDERILIGTYGLIRSHIEFLEKHQWSGVVIDESHNIKNPSALITKAVQRLNAHSKIALSGTPVMNNTFDLYSQFEFLVPGLLGGPEFFRKEYADPIDKDGNEIKSKLLFRITSPYIMRRTKTQVAKDLPEKTVSILWCEMEEKQRAIYQEIKSQIRSSIFLNINSSGLGQAKMGILAGITKLKQICCTPVLLDEYKSFKNSESIKLQLLMEELSNQLTKQKVLVFSQFKGMLHLIASGLKKEGIPHYHFDGDTKLALRQEMVDAFNMEEDPARVFLISLKAGNTGLNLTAAEYVFLVDPWWNTAVEDQAIDRAHRIGQTKHVMAYKMICKDSIEERIINIQLRKGKTAQDLIKTEESYTKTYSEDEIDTLFKKSEDGFVKDLTQEDVEYLFS